MKIQFGPPVMPKPDVGCEEWEKKKKKEQRSVSNGSVTARATCVYASTLLVIQVLRRLDKLLVTQLFLPLSLLQSGMFVF